MSKRKLEPPTCEECNEFLYAPAICGDRALCEYCSFGFEVALFPQSMFDWLETSFPEEWAKKKTRYAEEMMSRLPPTIRVNLAGIPETETKEALMRAFLQTRSLDLQVAVYGKEVLPIKSVFRTVFLKTKESPLVVQDCLGYLSVLDNELCWQTLLLVERICVTIVPAIPLH